MKYDKNAISSVANRLRNKSSGLNSIQSRLGNIAPKKCSPNFYSRRYSLVKRIRNVHSEINSLSNDIIAAANKMSSNDVQNASYIRQIFKNRASRLSFGNRGFSAGRTGLYRSGVFGESMLFSSVALNKRSVSSLGRSKAMSDVWSKLSNKFKSGAISFVNKAVGFGNQAQKAVTGFFSEAGHWMGERLEDLHNYQKSVYEYTWKSTVKFILGDFSDENITVLSFAANIITGFFDVDLPLDVRDLVYDIIHWGEGDNFGIYFALDCIALVPVIGVTKYLKFTDDIADGAKDLGKVIEAGTEAGKTLDNVSDAVDSAKDIGKAAEAVQETKKFAKAISFKETCIDHMVNGDGIKGKNISGAHNMKSFEKTIVDAGGSLDESIVKKVKHPSIDGIYEITYKVPGASKAAKTPKTVYDPDIISDADIKRWAEEAFRSDRREVADGVISGTASNGLKFQGYIDEETGVIRSAFPVLD